jgi:GDP-L-fucose synthase
VTAGTPYALEGRTVYVAGHRGMVGSALVRRLASENCRVITASREELDLLRQDAVEAWMEKHRPDTVIVAAAKVGGILANDRAPAEFLRDNLVISTNLIHAAHASKARKLLYLGSSCIYPKFAPQPISEDALLSGPLEPTNQWYAIAKIAGLKLCQAYRRQYGDDFISAMPTNLYGPGDNFDLTSSHVLPALIRKADDALREGRDHIEVWGSGTPRREFLHVDDCADALVYLLKHYSGEDPVNVGTSQDIAIADLARLISGIAGLAGEPVFDRSKPDGTPRKLLDVSRLTALGWSPSIDLRDGVEATWQWYLQNAGSA